MRAWLDFILPHLCPGCQIAMHTPGFCPTCWVKLDFIIRPYCDLCGNPGILGAKNLCRACRLDTPLFNSHRSLWRYGPLSRRIIFGLKHGRQRYIADLVAPWMVSLALQHPVDCMIPVPLNADRLAKRGFNQAALLATALGRWTGIPVVLNGLTRPLKTPSQGGFSAIQRRENVMGVFSSPKTWHGQKILLIDDVFTTGSTLNACAHVLRECGAHHIHAITLAKVPGG